MNEKQSTIHFEHIHWRSFLQVKSRKKADVLLQRISDALGTSLELQQCERYWKDETLYEAAFSTLLATEDVVQATFVTLCIAQKLAHHWTISGPHEYANNVWELSGYVSHVRIAGVGFTTFSVINAVNV